MIGRFVRRALLGGAIVAVTASLLGAQVIRGRVLDSLTGRPVVRATVFLVQGRATPVGRPVLSDSGGNYRLVTPRRDEYRVLVNEPHYAQRISDALFVGAADTITLDLHVAVQVPGTKAPSPLGGPPAPPPPGFAERQKEFPGTFWTQRDIRNSGESSLPALLDRTKESDNKCGVTISKGSQDVPATDGCVLILKAGLLKVPPCPPAYFLNSNLLARDATLLPPEQRVEAISIDDVVAVEIYSEPGKVPPQFAGLNARGACGAILVWTSK